MMNMKERMSSLKGIFNAERAKSRQISMEKGIGYGIGYVVTTTKEEAKGIGREIAATKAGEAIRSAASHVADGYHDGCTDAYEAYVARATERAENKRQWLDMKATREAQQRLNDAVNEMAEAIQ